MKSIARQTRYVDVNHVVESNASRSSAIFDCVVVSPDMFAAD